MARRRFGLRKGINIMGAVKRIILTVVMLYAGGVSMSVLGDVMVGTDSGFYKGLTLIGWTVAANNTITATADGGLLLVMGILAMISILTYFIRVY